MMHLKKHYIFSTRSKSNIFILSFKSDNLSQFSFDLFTTSTSISCLYAYMAALKNLDPFLTAKVSSSTSYQINLCVCLHS